MLSLAKISAGPGAARYYTDQVALGREDYYSGQGEEPGRWIGGGAAAAGLGGEVEAGQFAHLLTGGGLRGAYRDGAVAGFDLTFRAPKSVSILWGIADRETARQLGEAHDAAVQASLAYLEREGCWARRGKGGAIQVKGEGFVVAAFRHRASRASDPLLHTHAVVGNLVLGPDGRWTAPDARYLYRHLKTTGFLYQAELRREVVERLGLEWGPVEQGTADVEGVRREVIEHFSQRRREIEQHMRKHGGRSAKSAQIAALETRRAKKNLSGDRLREQWRARAAEHGLTMGELERILEPGTRAVPIAAGVAPEAMTHDSSVFGRPELLRALAEAQPQGARIEELERLADATLENREVIALPNGPVPAGLTERRYTTQELLEIEHDLLHRAELFKDTATGNTFPAAVDAALLGRGLSAEQEAVVRQMCLGGGDIATVRAAAGTGKTFVLDAAREAWETEGLREVVGCALSARAALELSDQSGIPSMTIAQLNVRLEDGGRLPLGGILVVDEAGMVGTRDLARLAQAANLSTTKLVLVGDDRQLPEIQAGGAFHALAEQLPKNELRQIHRQKQAWDRQALDELRSGEVEKWARAYRDHGQITVGDTTEATRTALINDWSKAEGDRLIIAARREDVRDLNQRARAFLQDRGELAPDQLDVGDHAYARGDRVIGARNERRAGILNGQRGTVTAADAERCELHVALDTGSDIRLGREYLEAGDLHHAYAITAHRAQGTTVDRTFVLGSEELYREWGYTAMSRHKQDARFYVAGGDLRPEPDIPLHHDHLVYSITSLLNRSGAKGLAIDELPAADRRQLEQERRDLRQTLKVDPPPDRVPHVEETQRERIEREIDSTRRREQQLLERRVGLGGWRNRHERAEVEQQLGHTEEALERLAGRLGGAIRRTVDADVAEHEWLATHGPEAARFLAVDDTIRREAATRDHVEHQLEAHHRDPVQPPHLDQDLGLDL